MVGLAEPLGAAPHLPAISSSGYESAADDETHSESDRNELLQVFQRFDEDGDGKISREELWRSLAKLGFKLTEAELVAMMAAVDENSNGFIESEEFLSLHKSLFSEKKAREEEEEKDLMEAFRVFDKDADGFISAHELQVIFSSLGLAEGTKLTHCQNMIRGVDLDGDGQVSFSEFKTMMNNKRSGKKN